MIPIDFTLPHSHTGFLLLMIGKSGLYFNQKNGQRTFVTCIIPISNVLDPPAHLAYTHSPKKRFFIKAWRDNFRIRDEFRSWRIAIVKKEKKEYDFHFCQE